MLTQDRSKCYIFIKLDVSNIFVSRNRYNEDAQALARFGEGGEEMTDEITQQTLLPGVKDPNLWMVKCVPGTEKETLLKIMHKYISHEMSDDPNYEPLQIR